MAIKKVIAALLVLIMLICLVFEALNGAFTKNPSKAQSRIYHFCDVIYSLCLVGIALVVVASSILRSM
ncbi:hypothetical protein BGL34_05805 [Fructilactobacillus lindneri]|uniref:Uncharacterized protein n=1 Tax=Fructilactobacillus lindneri TaxID=53444 RepID=A0AB33BMB4_9LACO|nr:hypothetical protein AYR60_00830 [Fructilactobacillus lindneri]POH23265.1 hypothetical protein BHU33_05555 [Fructilactobacillus lindneri DSM 20690 = JCM 11027]ANZ58697.1 hypothetical protein AYR59_00830 [Fructilactobacillus lindneri]POG97915.1 hypothetical protein BGL31_05270 [Fructilactobacillus lindneri]POG99247.1 hypothetical protein BGL32_05295 [Fructilactobacillus lindneri]